MGEGHSQPSPALGFHPRVSSRTENTDLLLLSQMTHQTLFLHALNMDVEKKPYF